MKGHRKSMEKVIESVVKKLTPSQKEVMVVESLCKKIMEVAKSFENKYNFTPMFCGSVAKGTWIQPVEIDLFLIFPENLSREELEKRGLEAGKKICKKLKAKFEKKYTEHAYLRCFVPWKGKLYEMDIVPCYDIAPEKIKSAVDRTPWHVRYVIKHLKEEQKNDVRLLKKFCKAHGVYGADVLHKGFSGYLCELLIIKFGSFEKLVQEASNWYPQVLLYIEKLPEKNIIEQFKESPLVFIDPVDEKRNVAAALSFESFFKFVKACKEFIKNPSEKFFFPKEKSFSVQKLREILRKRDSKFYVLMFPSLDVHEDILASQLRKLAKFMKKKLTNHGFSIHKTEYFILKDKFGILIEAEVWKLPKVMKRTGPEIMSKHAKEFLKHYASKKAWIEDCFWVIEDEREFQTIDEFIKKMFSGSCKKLKEKGIPSYIAKQGRKLTLYTGDFELIKLACENEEFKKRLSKYFEENLNIFSAS